MIKFFKSVVVTATLLSLPVAHAVETNKDKVDQKSTVMPKQGVKVTSFSDFIQQKATLKAQKDSGAITKAEFKEKKKELKMAYKAHKKEVKEEYKAKRKALKDEIKALKAKEKALKEEMKALKKEEKAEEKIYKEKMKAEKKKKKSKCKV